MSVQSELREIAARLVNISLEVSGIVIRLDDLFSTPEVLPAAPPLDRIAARQALAAAAAELQKHIPVVDPETSARRSGLIAPGQLNKKE